MSVPFVAGRPYVERACLEIEMRRFAALIGLVMVASPALSDYSEHHGVELFTKKPCTAAVGTIDADPEPQSLGVALSTGVSLAMAWGFVLGFDAAEGGLQGDEKTTLIRLRKACAERPDATAYELLRGFRE